jgi:spore coat protein F
MSGYQRLAWHETLELHELVAFQSVCLIKLKRSIPEIQNQELRNLYAQTIQILALNLCELLAFYPRAPYLQDPEIIMNLIQVFLPATY